MTSQIQRSAEGYLLNPDDWSETVAAALAEEEDIELTDDVWPALRFIRSYYREHGITPDVRHLITYLADEGKIDKKQAKKLIFHIFPYGYVKQACKIAGMQQPRAWSTG
ncbi:MAG: TusE/DsrC/DsvC family sulfur relay protein [Granulosicoccaceae bacterium]